MRTKVVIAEGFPHLEEPIRQIVATGAVGGEMLHDGRNKLWRIQIGGEDVVVKRFARPFFVNQLVYTRLRLSKAARAFRNGLALRKAGFDTPEPIAYAECRERGLFTVGYYICRYTADPTAYRLPDEEYSVRCSILDALADYTLALHRAGVYFYDYNAGNILYRPEGEGWHFSLVDINRIKFYGSTLDMDASIKMLAHLRIAPESQARVLARYVAAREWNYGIVAGRTLLRQGRNTSVRIRMIFKRLFGIKPRR